MRNENVRFSHAQELFWRFALQIPNDPPRHVLHVDCAFAQIGIIDFGQRLRVIARYFLKNPFDVATLGLQSPQHFVDQGPIFDHQQMRVEDGSVFGADRFRDLLLHLEDLHARLHERGFETCDLVSNLRRLDMIADNVVEIITHDMNYAVRKSGRNANSLIPRFLVTAAHPRAILSRNQSSWKRALINSSNSAIALAASGPSQRM